MFLINSQTYADLLAKYKPKVIKTDEENEQATALAEELTHETNKTADEKATVAERKKLF